MKRCVLRSSDHLLQPDPAHSQMAQCFQIATGVRHPDLGVTLRTQARHFAIHVLDACQSTLSPQFASRNIDRFAGVKIIFDVP
jgi:hypothetical protein